LAGRVGENVRFFTMACVPLELGTVSDLGIDELEAEDSCDSFELDEFRSSDDDELESDTAVAVSAWTGVGSASFV